MKVQYRYEDLHPVSKREYDKFVKFILNELLHKGADNIERFEGDKYNMNGEKRQFEAFIKGDKVQIQLDTGSQTLMFPKIEFIELLKHKSVDGCGCGL